MCVCVCVCLCVCVCVCVYVVHIHPPVSGSDGVYTVSGHKLVLKERETLVPQDIAQKRVTLFSWPLPALDQ